MGTRSKLCSALEYEMKMFVVILIERKHKNINKI